MFRSLRRVMRKVTRLRIPRVIRMVRAESLTYLSDAELKDLYDRVVDLERCEMPGILVEAGCAAGGSAIVLASAKAKSRPLYVYDVFGMIPQPSERDGPDVHERYNTIKSGTSPGINGNKYYGYEEDLLTKVNDSFDRLGVHPEENNVHFVQGRYEDVLRIDKPVALAHVDCDWYQSVLTCLQQIEPHLVMGGVLVIDDYPVHGLDGYSGCRSAVDEYFADKKDRHDFVFRSRLHIVRR